MKFVRTVVVFLTFIVFTSCSGVFARDDNLDENGGHDTPDGYHFHHGFLAHQHPNGYCQYDDSILPPLDESSGSMEFRPADPFYHDRSTHRKDSCFTCNPNYGKTTSSANAATEYEMLVNEYEAKVDEFWELQHDYLQLQDEYESFYEKTAQYESEIDEYEQDNFFLNICFFIFLIVLTICIIIALLRSWVIRRMEFEEQMYCSKKAEEETKRAHMLIVDLAEYNKMEVTDYIDLTKRQLENDKKIMMELDYTDDDEP